jgi:hypothetical protein
VRARYRKIEEKLVEDFAHRPRKPGGWKEDQLSKGEAYVYLESKLGVVQDLL